MKAPKILAFDIDGVLADLHTAWLDEYNKDFDDNLTISYITQWEMDKFVKPECGKKIFNYLKRPLFV